MELLGNHYRCTLNDQTIFSNFLQLLCLLPVDDQESFNDRELILLTVSFCEATLRCDSSKSFAVSPGSNLSLATVALAAVGAYQFQR